MAEKHPIDDLHPPGSNSLSASDSDSRADDASDYELTGIPLVLVMTGLGLSIFLMSLDSSIIATAIPRITSQFNSTSDIGWYGSAYSFAMCALQPVAGKLFASFAMKGMFLGCLAVFELGSLLCALAVNSPMLIVGRAIAGIGAAGCFTGAFCIVAVSIPLVKRPFYIGILQSTFGIATIIGPVLGGAFTEHATWRWCFWINLPIGAVTIFSLVFFFKPPTRDSTKAPTVLHRLQNLDLLGASIFAPAIIMIFLALQWGGTEYAWKSATIIGLFIGGAGLGLVFALWQIRRGDSAMIPPRLITERTMFFSCFSEFFAMGAVYISIYYLPEWFQVIKNASPTKSGVMYLPLALSDVLSATLTGASLKYLGYPNPYMLLGTGLMSIATGLFSTFSLSTPHQQWIPFQVLQGLGVGMTLSMPYVATQTVLKPEDIPVGTSLLQCFQFFGASVNLAIAEAIFENKLVSRLEGWGFEGHEIEKIISAGSAEARSAVSAAQLPGVLDAYNHAITRTFYVATSVAAVAFLLSLGIRWRSVKPKPQAAISDEEISSSSR
ncbi:Major facilitator superfamily domain general substrate transporter [Penicillium cf. griseofulvum]|uniref:Major facilitator superfamily domain general substrate transporter n=1 Tax=Penicillium cf. griseofulvum TaxID=2972120 RepID=A0A9W9ITS4_9EURO|nr:Major facilitator superfamily domain general substrate transporter [Penicillium cf. griseofulvum]KAJ5430180.1 Major facilitator superfamily domain general substrate transporter [Penicillium cf. griseofulvum]KAJ5436048.1 Major facilitator superfamily domain general substrate transporter [Penicillium cf. griseofulvum]